MEAGSEPPDDGHGDGQVVSPVGICSEAAYPRSSVRGPRLGGQMIVTPSNNYSPFPFLGSPAQQGQFLRMRWSTASAICADNGSLTSFGRMETRAVLHRHEQFATPSRTFRLRPR